MPQSHTDVASIIANGPTLMSPSGREKYATLETEALELQNRIDEIRRQIALVRVNQNALLPASQPDETLLVIFAHLAPVLIGSEPVSPSLCRDIVAITHVCAHWRKVALAEPTLWTAVPIYAMEQAAAFFERSRSEPLRVAVGPRFPVALDVPPESLRRGNTDSDPRVVLPHAPRLRSVSLTCAESNSGRFSNMMLWLDVLLDPARTLENLSVRANFGYHWDTYNRFNGTHPSLRSLTLDQVEVMPDFPGFGFALHHLTLAQPPQALGFADREFLEILRRCPNLVTLTLNDYRDHGIDEETNEIHAGLSTPIALPMLSTLTLRRVHLAFPNLVLRGLELPATTKIDIEISHPSKETNRLVLPQSPSSLPSLAGLRHLDISVEDWTSAPPDDSYDDRPFLYRWGPYEVKTFVLRASRGRDLDPSPALTLHVNYDGAAPRMWSSQLSSLIDVRSVETYDLRFNVTSLAYDPFANQMWYMALKDLMGLRILRLRSPERALSARVCAPLLSALSSTSTAHDGVAGLVCSSLETLALEGIDCDDEFWRVLERMIVKRRAAGVSPSTEVVLKDLVGIVDVDHVEVWKVCKLLGEVFTLEYERCHLSDSGPYPTLLGT